jgi:hypothetical protein
LLATKDLPPSGVEAFNPEEFREEAREALAAHDQLEDLTKKNGRTLHPAVEQIHAMFRNLVDITK